MRWPLIVYLASSAHADWRAAVRQQYATNPDVRFVGPCENHALSDRMGAPGDRRFGHKLRTMQMMRKCDLVFAAIPDDRYRGFNVILEIGLAKAWGRPVLFTNVPESLETELEFLRPLLDGYFRSLEEGLARLEEILQEGLPKTSPELEIPEPIPTGNVTHRVALVGREGDRWIEQVQQRYADRSEVELYPHPDLETLRRCDLLLAVRSGPEDRRFPIPFFVGAAAGWNLQTLFVNVGDHYSHAYDYVKPYSEGYYTDLDEALAFLDYAMGFEEHR